MNMNNYKDPYNNSNFEDEIDLTELFFVLWNHKFKIILFSFASSVLGVYMALNTPNTYTSSAMLTSSSDSGSSLSSLAGQYSGLASLAGISIASGGSSDPVLMAVEKMKSLSFFEKLVEDNEYLYIGLQAASGWDSQANKIIINPKVYDALNSKWVSTQEFAVNGKPSLQSAHLAFRNKFGVGVVPETGFIKLAFTHYSPHYSKEILDTIILEINKLAKDEEIAIAEETIKFLKNEASNTQLSDLRFVINSLIQKQIETIALANASPEFLLKTLSAPYAPQVKTGPSRKVIVIIFGFIGFALISTFYLIKHYFFNSKKN